MTELIAPVDEQGVTAPAEVGIEGYRAALRDFDAATCEAIAVGQAAAVRYAGDRIGYGTHIFARMCGHAIALVRAAPKSRWVSADHEWWDFALVAGHARSIIEAYMLFAQLLREPTAPGEGEARIEVMHLNDCTKRISILERTDGDRLEWFRGQAEELRASLRLNPYFQTLPEVLRNRLLTGRYLTIQTRDEQLAALGWEKPQFDAFWDTLSQYTHVLPFSFYSMEPNGRGTGMPNACDRSYMAMVMTQCTPLIAEATDTIVNLFPDVEPVRQGLESKFSPGPRRNLPKDRKRRRQ